MVTIRKKDLNDGEAATYIDFSDLENEAARVEGLEGGTEGAPGQSTATPIDPLLQAANDLEQALKMAKLIVKPMFAWWTDFESVWSDSQVRAVADAGAAVMSKHGWTTGDVFAQFGPYIALGIALIPPAIATKSAVTQHREKIAAQARAAKHASSPETVQSGDPQ